ncbi:MAG TPA: Rrf2 family transcriptional regulator [Chitinispirillaceae bacterium]|jgi:Rrf2 family cysteine metabolism transcriptional repressor|nr:Rrf2 family transcriptional regulator [Chitinispirillaceae bacterium]
MLALSTKSHYGLCAILEIAGNYSSRLTQAREIVEKYKIPQPYLEQLLNRLSKAGIIKSIRGKNGGYDMAAHPSEITLLDVLVALEGELELCKWSNLLSVQGIFNDIEDNIREKMSISINDLLMREKENRSEMMFYI